jgi:hypothetical protein
MTWIQTYSGRQFDPRSPAPADFAIEDIAHALSHLCRFNGHCRVFYSVAEHSVRVSMECPREHALWGLLHDMGEAYVGDLPRPIKASVPEHTNFESSLLQVAAQGFGLSWPIPEAVHRADDRLLATEARDLMAPPPQSWGLTAEPLAEEISPWSPALAKQNFLARFHELTREPPLA